MLRRLADTVIVWEKNETAKWVIVVMAVLIAFVVSVLLIRILIDLFWPAMLVTFFGAVWYVARLVDQGDINLDGVPSSFVYGGIAFLVPIVTFPLAGLHVVNRRLDANEEYVDQLHKEIDDLRAKLTTLQAATRKDEKSDAKS